MVNIHTEHILYFMSNLFRIYVVFRFLQIFYDRTHVDKWLETGIITIYYLVNSYAFIMFKIPLINLGSNLISFFLLTFLYKGRLFTRLVSTALIYAVNMVLDSIVYVVLKAFGEYETVSINSILSNILLYLFVLILGRLMKDKKNYGLRTSHWIAFFLMPVGSIVVVVTIFFVELPFIPLFLIVSYLLGVNVLSFYLYDIVAQYYAKQYENELLNRQNHAYQNEFELIKETQENINMLWHDMKNHNYKIQSLVLKDKKAEVLEYLNTILEHVNLHSEYVYSGNTEVDSILNYKLQEAKKIGTKISANINIPNQIKIDAFDINVILGNLLDNSIEALKQCAKKVLKLHIEYERGVLYLSISNTYTGRLIKKDDFLLTTKPDKINHGIGLKSVEHMLFKYHGTMEFQYDEKYFQVDVLLYNPINLIE